MFSSRRLWSVTCQNAFAPFFDEEPTRVQRNLHTKDRSEAVKLALQVVSSGTIENPASTLQVETLDSAFEKFTDYLKLYCRPSSVKRCLPVVRLFIDTIGGKQSTRAIDRRCVTAFRDRRASTCSKHTVNGDVVRVGSFIRWMLGEGMVDRDFTLGIRPMRTPTTARESVTPEAVRAVLKAFEGHPWLHDWVNVMANTGMRPQEALHIRGMDLDANARLLHIRAWGDWQVKDAEDRQVLLNEPALQVLIRRKLSVGADELPLFVSSKGKPRGYMSVFHRFKELLPQGLEEFSPYRLRGYFATRAVAAGWPAEKLMVYLGHSHIDTTWRYYADRKALMTGMPPVTTLPTAEPPAARPSRSAR